VHASKIQTNTTFDYDIVSKTRDDAISFPDIPIRFESCSCNSTSVPLYKGYYMPVPRRSYLSRSEFFLQITEIFVAGEGGEEGSPEEGDKLEGDEDTGSMTPNSAASPPPPEEDAASPTPGDVPTPSSPRSVSEDPLNCRYIIATPLTSSAILS
jgi:hypothetical protein